MKTFEMHFEDEPNIPPARVGISIPSYAHGYAHVNYNRGAAALCAAEGDFAYDKEKRNYPKNTKRKRRGKYD